MSRKGKRWNELQESEDPAIELLERLGWRYLEEDDAEKERSSLKETVLSDRLGKALKRLNPWMSPENVTKAIKQIMEMQVAEIGKDEDH